MQRKYKFRIFSAVATLVFGLMHGAVAAGPATVSLPELLQVQGCEACGQMVLVPVGAFIMGSPESEPSRNANEGPQHKVNLTSFEIGRTEVTQGQWKAVMRYGFWEFLQNLSWSKPWVWPKQIKSALRGNNVSSFLACGDACPVDNISWDDTQAFIQRLNKITGKSYRLPTEAEWEHAARAGSSHAFFWGPDINPKKANYNGTIAYNNGPMGEYRQTTVRADAFEPNAFGIYNMHGNTWEWMQDCWNPDYRDAPTNGSAWLTGDCKQRVLRGGSWIDTPINLRSAYRVKDSTTERFPYQGFRLARSLP